MEKQNNKRVYHHTKFENLVKIIKSGCIKFRGSYYEKFNYKDYKWTKEYASSIIEKICIDRGHEYTNDSSFKPIIISFNQEEESDYMWKEYADGYRGIQLVLDYDAIRAYAKQHLDYFNECEYMNSKEEIEVFLKGSMDKLEVIAVNDYQSNLEALSGLIKRTDCKQETEIRYVHPYSKMVSVNYEEFKEKGDGAFCEIKPEEDDEECFVIFPKEILLGITVGYEVSNKIEEVKYYLQKCGFDINKMEIKALDRKC